MVFVTGVVVYRCKPCEDSREECVEWRDLADYIHLGYLCSSGETIYLSVSVTRNQCIVV